MKRLWLTALLLWLGLGGPAAAETPQVPPAERVAEQALEAVRLRAQAQKLADEFRAREEAARDQIEALAKELELAKTHRHKTEVYLAGQKAKLAQTERQIAAAAKIKLSLDPLLDETWRRLGEMDQPQPPWERAAAQARLRDIKELLDDYEASPAAKTLALLGELRLRATQANTVEVTESDLEIAGQRLQVQLLRLGGLGWYALGMDGQKAWRWDQAAGVLQPMDDFAGQLDQALAIAQRHRVVNLVALPLPPAENTLPPAKENPARQAAEVGHE
ncbi:MAG: DUF3450 domain-containing protein [Deltaproteobacteria bacterium]|nr:DUF3450 domain-containing protein [Deltaproteobacteria bacterium]